MTWQADATATRVANPYAVRYHEICRLSEVTSGERVMVVPEHPRLVFFYGSREVLRTGIGRALFAEKGAIRDVLIRCERLIRERLGWSLEKVCIAEQLPSEDQREPCLTALQIALTEGWRARGAG